MTLKGHRDGLVAANTSLPRLMLEAAMTAAELVKFRYRYGITTVVEAPGADDAGKLMGHWGYHRSASYKTEGKNVTASD